MDEGETTENGGEQHRTEPADEISSSSHSFLSSLKNKKNTAAAKDAPKHKREREVEEVLVSDQQVIKQESHLSPETRRPGLSFILLRRCSDTVY